MIEDFYTKTLSLAVRFVVLLISTLIASQLVFFYVIYSNYTFYLGYLMVLWFSFWYGTKIYHDYQSFRESLSQGLYFPRASDNDIEPLNLEPEEFNEVALKACLLYQKGVGYKKIGETLQPEKRFHGQTVRRLIKKGLGILIEDYESHNSVLQS